MHIPRVGQEVIVDFLEGDPDRPIITGRVYHGANKPPYPLPDEKTKSTIKSDSSPGGGGYNEIRFEDKKGSEQLYIHAEMNEEIRVEKDAMEWIGQDRHLVVTRDHIEAVKGDKHLEIVGDQNEKVGGAVSLTAGDLLQKLDGTCGVDAGKEIHLKAGMNLVIHAGMQLTLKGPGGFIDITPAGVIIAADPGKFVMVNSGGAPGVGSGVSPGVPLSPLEADKAKPGAKAAEKPPTQPGPKAASLIKAAKSGAPFCCAACV
jgi:type VI secretion system secreted protein VgrG